MVMHCILARLLHQQWAFECNHTVAALRQYEHERFSREGWLMIRHNDAIEKHCTDPADENNVIPASNYCYHIMFTLGGNQEMHVRQTYSERIAITS